MDQILINLNNPEWWFTGLFFLVIGLLLKKVVSFLPTTWRKLVQYIPALNRGISRWFRLKFLREVRTHREKDLYIIWVICRYWSMYILIVVYAGFILFYFAISKDISLKGGGLISKTFISVLPIYAISIYMIFEKKYLFRLLKENHKYKKRITKNAARDASHP